MKKYLFFLCFLVAMAIAHITYLLQISKLETEISQKRNRLVEIQKEIERTNLVYDEKADIEHIASEMQEKHGMEVFNTIQYFKINQEK